MSSYQVLITGSAYIEVEADSPANASQIAAKKLGDMRFGIWDMNLDFTCDESDLIEDNENANN